jgi:hypothetical protein
VWQPSIVQTIAQYIRLHSDSANPDADARALFADLLNTAEAHRRRIGAFRLDAAGLSPADWLCIIGVDAVTRVRLEIVRGADGTPDFRFRGDDRANQWGNPDPAQAEFTGDGTVPFEGAVPAFLPRESLVCVTPDDFGYWEIQDKLTTQIAGFHGILPNMDMLHRMIVRFFTNAPDRHDNTWGRPAPGVAAWAPPLPLKNKAGG